MISNLLKEKITEKSKELDAAIENGEDMEIIFQKGIEIDQLIAECLICKKE